MPRSTWWPDYFAVQATSNFSELLQNKHEVMSQQADTQHHPHLLLLHRSVCPATFTVRSSTLRQQHADVNRIVPQHRTKCTAMPCCQMLTWVTDAVEE